jgi:hypothetical protein
MNRRIAAILSAAVCALAFGRAAAEPAEASLSVGFSAAASAVAAAKLEHFSLASNDTNSPEIFREVAAVSAPECVEEVIDDGGFPTRHKTCRVAGRLERVTVFRNEIIWRSTKVVDVVGDIRCGERWIATGGARRSGRLQLWTFCDFDGTVEKEL